MGGERERERERERDLAKQTHNIVRTSLQRHDVAATL